MELIFFENLSTNNKNNIYAVVDYKPIINFEDFFDLLDDKTINTLNRLLEFSKAYNPDYISMQTWIYWLFCENVNIPPIAKQIFQLGKKDDMEMIYKYGGKNVKLDLDKKQLKSRMDNITKKDTKNKTYIFTKKDDANVSSSNIKCMTHTHSKNFYEWKFKINSQKIATCSNNYELLYAFIDCLFSANNKFYIKKCNLCEKFYIATKSDNHYCKRKNLINDKYYTCANVAAILQKTYEYTQVMNFNKNFLEKLKRKKNIDPQYIDDYIKYRDTVKLKYFKTKDIKILQDAIYNYEKRNPITYVSP